MLIFEAVSQQVHCAKKLAFEELKLWQELMLDVGS